MFASKQILRCYPLPDPKEKKEMADGVDWGLEEADSDIAAGINRVGTPWAGPMLFVDDETLTGAKDGQGLRFGCFQERGLRYRDRVKEAAAGTLTRKKLDTLWHEGIFYEPKNCTAEEIACLKLYAAQYELDLYTREDFIKKIFYRNHYIKYANDWEERLREPCYVIGHNLGFDLGALTIHCGLARKDLYGGLSLVLAGGEHDPEAETKEAFKARLEAWATWEAARMAIKEGKPVGAVIEHEKYGKGTILAVETETFGGVAREFAQVKFGDETRKIAVFFILKEPQRHIPFEHRIAIKKLAFGRHFLRSPKLPNGTIEDGGISYTRRTELVQFIDTQMLACALLGPGPSSMKALLERLNVPKKHRKETADYHGPITPEYISYCRSDVENTWQIYKGCRELHRQQNLDTPMHRLYSGASLGKAYYGAFGIGGFNELNPDFDPFVLGCFMESYYGGQADVRIRHHIVEVIHCDFKSQYPTINVLMGLQDFLIADQIGVTRDDPEARRFLKTVWLDDLQRKETWRKMRGVALIAPDDDILPYRTQYGEEEEDGTLNVNIGVNRVISACPAWYSFPDIIKTKLLTGRTPKILKTLELYPIGRQRTDVAELFGQEQYTVDLNKDGFFKTVIDMRIDAQKELDDPLTPEDRKAFLGAFQNGLKITANGTSYGVPNEFIVDDHLKEVPTTVFFSHNSARVKARAHSVGVDGDEIISDYKAEKAGRFYAPWGVLIPAGGRLLLGIAERLAKDRGLAYSFCDTDSMSFADYHNKYSRKEFREKVKGITDWFQPLNPYKNDVRLFGLEKVNFRLKNFESGKIVKGEHAPLYCLAVSSKRYCLFNLVEIEDAFHIVIRKASAHGLGDVMLPTKYKAKYEHFAAPLKNQNEFKDNLSDVNIRSHGALVAGSAAPLFLDMWYAAIKELMEKGTLDGIDKVVGAWPELKAPQHSQTSLSTRDAWLNYQNLPNRRAFQFFETLPALMRDYGREPDEIVSPSGPTEPKFMQAEITEAENSSLYTAFSKPFELDLDNLYRRDTNELIKPYLEKDMRLTTVADRVEGYFAHGEAKSEGIGEEGPQWDPVRGAYRPPYRVGGQRGLLKRKCVVSLTKAWVGKESHPLADVEDVPDQETQEHYATSGEILEDGLNHDLIARAGISEIAKATRIDEKLLVDVVVNRKALRPDLLSRVYQAISVYAEGRIEVNKVPITKQETAIQRIKSMWKKGKKFRALSKFIHEMKSVEIDARILAELVARKIKEPENARRIDTLIKKHQNSKSDWCGVTHNDIWKELDGVMCGCPPIILTLAEIETCAKKFYGIEERLTKKADKEAARAEVFKKSAINARARRDRSRTKGRGNEIKRIAEFWKMPELASVKTVRHAHLIDQFLHEIAATGAVPVRYVCGPFLVKNAGEKIAA
jgi:hypothetical protein